MKFSEFPKAVIKENVNYSVKEITNVIKTTKTVFIISKVPYPFSFFLDFNMTFLL